MDYRVGSLFDIRLAWLCLSTFDSFLQSEDYVAKEAAHLSLLMWI